MSQRSEDGRPFRTFEDLVNARKGLADALAENSVELARVLSLGLYTDKTHFIYELLQNAEDAGATTVEFNVRHDQLVVSHDGTREFSLSDVAAITNVGASDKALERDGRTQIGKFGVGFKAVFVYTTRPQVHSGPFSFEIRELFVPHEVASKHVAGQTVFVLPFDRGPELSARRAGDEILGGLRELRSTSLLFLRSIHTVRYQAFDGSHGSVSRSTDAGLGLDERLVVVTEQHDDDAATSHWLRFAAPTPKGLAPGHEVAVAFHVERAEETDRGNSSERFHVVPLAEGDTCVYFPAASERSGLKFHVHAPFASTVSRDTIVNDEDDNTKLIEGLCRVLEGALPELRDMGMINEQLLAALPNPQDVLDPKFRPLEHTIRQAFNNLPLAPVRGGGSFAPATTLVRSPRAFRVGLEREALPVLLGFEYSDPERFVDWIRDFQGRAGDFIEGLAAPEFGWEELESGLWQVEQELLSGERDVDDESAEVTVFWEWLESLSDEQLRSFYQLLGHGLSNDEFSPGFSRSIDLPIVRVTVDQSARHVLGKGIYLPSTDDHVGSSLVPQALAPARTENPTRQDEHLFRLFRACGVRPWDDRAIVEERLVDYRAGKKPSEKQYGDDLRLFVRFLQDNPGERSLFYGVPVLHGESATGEKKPCKPNELVIDEPYRDSGLAALYPERFKLISNYHERVGGIVEFAVATGAIDDFRPDRVPPWNNPQFEQRWRWGTRETSYLEFGDWDLRVLSRLLDDGDPVVLEALWRYACRWESSEFADGWYRANNSVAGHRFESRLLQRLRGEPWVLHRDGHLEFAPSMTVADLPDGWPHPGPGSIVNRAGFGVRDKADAEAEARRAEIAVELGTTVDVLEFIKGITPDELGQLKDFVEGKRAEEKASAWEGRASDNPDRRAEVARQDAEEAPDFESEQRQRAVSPRDLRRRKSFLRAQYEEDGQLQCQICNERSQFKVSDEWYFEAVTFVGNRRKEHSKNCLALCPLCAAKYQYAKSTLPEELLERLKEVDVGKAPQVLLPVTLYGEETTIRFTGQHFIDLQAALGQAGEERSGKG